MPLCPSCKNHFSTDEHFKKCLGKDEDWIKAYGKRNGWIRTERRRCKDEKRFFDESKVPSVESFIVEQTIGDRKISFQVTVEEYRMLKEKSGGSLTGYIRRALGLDTPPTTHATQ